MINQEVSELIESKLHSHLEKLTATRARSLRLMLYCGLRVTIEGETVTNTASELECSISYVTKLTQQFVQRLADGDVTVNLVVNAFRKMLAKNRTTQPRKKSASKPDSRKLYASAGSEAGIPCKAITTYTAQEEADIRHAIRESIKFMAKYGKGTAPRMNGEYYTPAPDNGIKETWLPLNHAALYCGTSPDVIKEAGVNGILSRRIYRKCNGHVFYEYLLSDLDDFTGVNT